MIRGKRLKDRIPDSDDEVAVLRGRFLFSLSDFPARSAIVEFEPGEVFRDVGEPQLRPPDRKSTGGKPFGFRFRFWAEGSYPGHARTLDGSSKERSLRVPPQVGQVMGCQGSRSFLGKGTLKP